MKKTVLVVDDEPHIVNLVKLTLNDRYRVIEAFSGVEALKVLATEKPDLVILDLMMPGMDGYSVCKQIRENAQTADIPILILSAKSQISDKFRSINVGADDYLVKPFEPDQLVRRVEMNLEEYESVAPVTP